jgi:predicted TIM-barrel fold metal-dependent hydrolase
MAVTTDAAEGTKPTTKRILMSADAHGGAPLGELMGVINRLEREAPAEGSPEAAAAAARPRGPRFADDGSGLNRSPQVLPEDRMVEMERDGVSAEVIFGGTGMYPGETLEDCIKRCQKTNDWMAETYKDHLNIMAPSISLPLPSEPYGGGDFPAPTEEMILAAAAELKRAALLGIRPGLMPDTSPKLGYNRPDWNPIWETACEYDIPMAFHVGFGTNPVKSRNPGGAVANYTTVASTIIVTVAQLCASGVFETFPTLQCAMIESNAGWLAWTMFQMDEAHKKHAHWAKPKLEKPPSDYARSNIKATFQEDPIAIANRHYTGLDSIMWGSDYPHWEGTWPRSQEAVEDLFKGVPEDEVDQIVHRNAEKFYKFKL